jgi:hypothetical protein
VSQFAPEDSQGSIDLVSNGDITFEADRDQDGVGDLVFRTGGVERARIKHDGSGTGWPNVLGGSMAAVTINSITPGQRGITVTDGNSPANKLFEVENIALDSSHYSGALIFSASGGGISGAGGETWGTGIDVAAGVPYRDYAIAYKIGGVKGDTAGSVYDFVYAHHRGTNPPTLVIGNSSDTFQTGQLELIMAADSSGNVIDTSLHNLRIHTALISGGSPSNQTTPAISVANWTSATDRFHVEVDGSVNLYDAGGGANVSIGSVSGLASFRTTSFNIGDSAFGGNSHTVQIKPTNANADIALQTTSGGALQMQCLNASGTVNLWTTNSSDLILGTNGTARVTIGKSAGAVTFADAIHLAVGTTTGTKIGTVGGASGQKLGFFGSTPIVQPLLATGASHTVDDVITALQNLGLARQS